MLYVSLGSNMCVLAHNSLVSHTPPEGSVRAKKKYITFDTNFGHYLPRGTMLSGEMPKKDLKTGLFRTFYFQYFSFWYL